MWRVVASYQAAIGAVIGRYQGMIAQYLGDGVLAYFGYPVAHEDSAVQAVRAALEIVGAVASLRTNCGTALQALACYFLWTACLGAIGAIAFLSMNALSIQQDVTFDLTNKSLLAVRIVLGSLFGVVLRFPLGFPVS